MEHILLRFHIHIGNGSASDGEISMFWWCLPFALAFVGFVYLRIKYKRKYKYWSGGAFPADLPSSGMNLMMAYLCAAVLLFHCDKALLLKKMGFLQLWLRRRFPEVKITIRDYIEEAMDNPVQVESLGNWFNKHLNPAQKEELLAFLLQLAFYDDTVQSREYDLLVYFAKSLEVGKDWLDQRIDQEHRARYERESRYKATETREASVSKKAKAFETLGLEVNATIQEIKQAYRKLVKLCHPDKFQQESEQVRKEAEAKFREIQEAYEYLQVVLA